MTKTLSAREILNFQKIVWGYYKKHGRKLPWRFSKDPYQVLVSEIMLQQTQVSRVLQKYPLFIKKFPTVRTLAHAPFSKILLVWSGLGYNRRAKFLHETAKIIIEKHRGVVPTDADVLVQLPSIGLGTAGAICAFAFNKPAIFIETNIRTVFIHHFFTKTPISNHTRHSNILQNVRMSWSKNIPKAVERKIYDREILPLIEKTLDKTNPRQWYYALMDYGVMLKEKYSNPSRKSAHHAKQSPFKNSNRQVRGEILKLLVAHKSVSKEKIKKYIKGDTTHIKNALIQLAKENFIKIRNNKARLAL